MCSRDTNVSGSGKQKVDVHHAQICTNDTNYDAEATCIFPTKYKFPINK